MNRCRFCGQHVNYVDEMIDDVHEACLSGELHALDALHRDYLQARLELIAERDAAIKERDAAIKERDTEREAITSWIEPRPDEVDWPTELLLRATVASIRRGDHRNPEKIKSGEKSK
jgi:hypothetical protein